MTNPPENSADNWQQRANQVIEARNEDEVRTGYDAWAEKYDDDHVNFGLLLLAHFMGLFCRHIEPGTGPILDAGAGTGRLGEALSPHGYGRFVAIDLSPGMLAVAADKPGYEAAHVMRLGDRLDFDDDVFPVVASLGAFAPNLAGADAFDDLIRVTRPGGLLVLSLRAGHEETTGFDRRRFELEAAYRWHLVDEVPDFISHPELDVAMRYGIHVYRKPGA